MDLHETSKDQNRESEVISHISLQVLSHPKLQLCARERQAIAFTDAMATIPEFSSPSSRASVQVVNGEASERIDSKRQNGGDDSTAGGSMLIDGAFVEVFEVPMLSQPCFEGSRGDTERERVRYEGHENMTSAVSNTQTETEIEKQRNRETVTDRDREQRIRERLGFALHMQTYSFVRSFVRSFGC